MSYRPEPRLPSTLGCKTPVELEEQDKIRRVA
jgi:hypothetical protein